MSLSTPQPIPVPSKEEFAAAVARFQNDWGMVDEILRDMCQRCPCHESPGAVRAKVALIERAYAAGLERHVEFSQGEQPIVVAGDARI